MSIDDITETALKLTALVAVLILLISLLYLAGKTAMEVLA